MTRPLTRREFVRLGALGGAVAISRPAVMLFAAPRRDVRITVFTLFRPRELTIRGVSGDGLALSASSGPLVLRATDPARLAIAGGDVVVEANGRGRRGRRVSCAALSGDSTEFELSVPGRIVRCFQGRLDVSAQGDTLIATITMDLETAVASVVAAELPGIVAVEAAKAQAVAARSYFVAAHGRHAGGAFCDTTHCQFLRDAPAADQPAARAARDTEALVLSFRGTPIEALYSASCGGRTLSLAEAGLSAGAGYPFFSVDCPGCLAQKSEWKGHGVGLCQVGAQAMALSGARYDEILAHYYAQTALTHT